MSKMGISKQELDDAKNIVTKAGIFTVAFQGFFPKKSKDGNSVNLNPRLVIVGDPEQNGKEVRYSLNFQPSTWFMTKNFVHMFGLKEEVAPDGSENIPGDWVQPDASKPETWKYNGPLMGRTGKIEVVPGTYNGKAVFNVKQMLCAVSGCGEKHSDNLIR